MVKGISRQVIMVHTSGDKLFEQAIFILKDEAVHSGVTDAELLKQAKQALRAGSGAGRRKIWLYGPVWACGGAILTGLVWLLTAFL